MESINTFKHREPWNKGKLVGQKAPFKLKEIWAIRSRLQMAGRPRDLALFDLGVDSKLRGATWSSYACAMCAAAIRSLRVRSSCNKKPNAQCSLR